MPSRKKAKGKARKAAKEAKAKEEESQAAVEVAAGQRQGESVEAMMQRLGINVASPKLCGHGYPCLSAGEEDICIEFINAFIDIFRSQDSMGEGFVSAEEATEEQYPEVYTSKLEAVISIILYNGTQCILHGDNHTARLNAMLASYFENYMAVNVHMTQATLNVSKIIELECADERTLLSYYRKYIPCSCLDEKYEEVKSMKKMGCCYNPNCSNPRGKVERSKMFSCARCRGANYCSVECQKADWKHHKKFCGQTVEMKAAFNSNQT